jgi:hypothetical protein
MDKPKIGSQRVASPAFDGTSRERPSAATIQHLLDAMACLVSEFRMTI